MKPDYVCVDHSDREAVSACRHCGDWFCRECFPQKLTEGPSHYYCHKPDCLKALWGEQGRCLQCGQMFNRNSQFCGFCGAPWKSPTSQGDDREDLVILRRYNSSVEAYLALGKLQSEEVAAYVADENIIDIYPGASLALGGARLLVKKSEVNRALEIIEATSSPGAP